MIKCDNCKHLMEDTCKFCLNCGSVVMLANIESKQENLEGVKNPFDCEKLGMKLFSSARIWLLAGIVQILFSAIFLVVGICGNYCLIIFVLIPLANSYLSIHNYRSNIKLGKNINSDTYSIVKRNTQTRILVTSLINNMFCGTFMGVIAALYDFSLRKYVVSVNISAENN